MSFFGSINSATEALNAFSIQIGNISDNIANASTTGYKSVETRFSDIVATKLNGASPVLDSTVKGSVAASAHFANRAQGQITADTDNPSYAAVSGNGYFPVAKATGMDPATETPTGYESTPYFTRQGDFHLDNAGHLVNSAGYYLMTANASGSGTPSLLTIDTTATNASGAAFSSVSIEDGGKVVVHYDDNSSATAAQIKLANFPEPDQLDRFDGLAFKETAKSGSVVYGSAADSSNSAGVGTVVGSAIEASTADTSQQMTLLLQTQQAYSLNSQVINTAADMLQTAIDMKS